MMAWNCAWLMRSAASASSRVARSRRPASAADSAAVTRPISRIGVSIGASFSPRPRAPACLASASIGTRNLREMAYAQRSESKRRPTPAITALRSRLAPLRQSSPVELSSQRTIRPWSAPRPAISACLLILGSRDHGLARAVRRSGERVVPTKRSCSSDRAITFPRRSDRVPHPSMRQPLRLHQLEHSIRKKTGAG